MNLLLKLFAAWGIPKRKILAEYAKLSLGKDMNLGAVDPDVACAVALNRIFQESLGFQAGGGSSTYRMYKSLRRNPRFKEMKIWEAEAGDIIISPTGFRLRRSTINNGHVGIMGENRKIMSNNSKTGFWDKHYTLNTWYMRYAVKGQYLVIIYRLVV